MIMMSEESYSKRTSDWQWVVILNNDDNKIITGDYIGIEWWYWMSVLVMNNDNDKIMTGDDDVHMWMWWWVCTSYDTSNTIACDDRNDEL